ncbi:MAG: radical SAM protein [Propionivibrio sp.]|nr:radical SAM protein [Propionivibrio sp.]
MARAPASASLRERLQGWREGNPRLGPEAVHIDITNVCNLDCITCWNYAPTLATPKSAEWKRQRLDPLRFVRIVDEVAATGTERIILSGGGEPFTHPAIWDFIGHVKARGLHLTLISNGTLIDFDRLAVLAPEQILLNLAAASADTYVAYHPNQPPATFARLLAGVNRLRGITAVNFVLVINAVNAGELVAMVELAAAHGARCSFKLGDQPPGTESYALDAASRAALLTEGIPEAMKRAGELAVRHNLDAFASQLAGAGPGKAIPCFAGYLYSRVFVDGRVFFCCEHIEAGHIDESDFATIWQSPPYRALRERLRAGRSFPGCARCGKHDMNFAAAQALTALDAQSRAADC